MIFIETQRLLLRQHESKDEQAFVAMQMDPEVRRYIGGTGWSLEKARDRFRKEYLGRPAETYGLWATILKEEAKYIGCCGLRASQNGAQAHFGYYFAQPYWRRGVASEAVKALIDKAFYELGLRGLVADVELGNTASEHILRKFGFNYVGREEIPAGRRVMLTYKLTREHRERRTM
jgi:RimJ/RimL family protein N-acetyltransferase